MLDNRKLAIVVWLRGFLPVLTYLFQIGFTYVSVNTAYTALERVEESHDRAISQIEQDGVVVPEKEAIQEHEQLETTLVRLRLFLLVTTVVQILLMANFLQSSTAKISQRLGQIASELDGFSSEITRTMALQTRNTAQQAAAVNQTTTTMDELNASSHQSAEQASSAAEQANQGLSLAESGLKAIEQTESAMSVLSHQVRDLQAQIANLTDKTNEIGKISKLVSDLANQTNMLALNAAVEAVRAGEHGKGFAVVASEIRSLADRSKASTNSIEALVADIQAAIDSTVTVTQEGSQMVDNGVAMSRETAEAFRGVTNSIDSIALNAQQISLNARQQALAIAQVVETMNNINQTAAETATSISQVKSGTEKLDRTVQVLKTMA